MNVVPVAIRVAQSSGGARYWHARRFFGHVCFYTERQLSLASQETVAQGKAAGSHCSRRRLERTHLPSSRLYATCPMIEFERTVNGVSHPSRDLRLNSRRIHHHSDPFASALAASILDCACRPAPLSQNEEFGERGATYHGKASSMAEPRQSSFRNGLNRLQLIVNSTDEMLMLKRHSIEDALPRLTRQLISRNL